MALLVATAGITAPRLKLSAVTRNSRLQQMSARQLVAHKTIGRRTFRFKPSAIKGRYDVEFETGGPAHVKFGAVLTRREVLALIECLGAGLRESEQGDESG
jgi:hypothetical protein